MRPGIALFCATWVASWPAYGAEPPCGDLANAYGPYDYRVHKAELKPVEANHFNVDVEQLRRGQTGSVAADLDYVLRSFPNHHRALMSMDRLTQRSGAARVQPANWTIQCYYDRAVRFRPDDGTVRMLYASFLARNGKPKEAIAHLQEAEKVLGDNANLHYNMGLAYVDVKDYDKALMHAHRAYQMGFTLPGLKAKLERAGKWREPSAMAARKKETPGTGAATAEGATEAPQVETSATSGSPAAKP